MYSIQHHNKKTYVAPTIEVEEIEEFVMLGNTGNIETDPYKKENGDEDLNGEFSKQSFFDSGWEEDVEEY